MLNQLRVKRQGEYYYVQYNNSDIYYHEMYQDRWSADATIIGLESIWAENSETADKDQRDLFVTGIHNCRLCQVEREYITRYGRDPIEALDEKARRMGRSYRVTFQEDIPPIYLRPGDLSLIRQLYPECRATVLDIS